MKMRSQTLILLLVLGAALSGCRLGGDSKSYVNENDELRRANLDLQRQMQATQKQIGLLEGELSAHQQRAKGASPIEGALSPVLSGLDLMRYSGPVDRDGDGADDGVQLYLRPMDQRGRMLVVAGRVDVQVLRVDGTSEPVVLAQRTFGPAELDAAYRTGLTGDHYSFELALGRGASVKAPGAEGILIVHLGAAATSGKTSGAAVTLVATLTESGTGVTVTAQSAFTLER